MVCLHVHHVHHGHHGHLVPSEPEDGRAEDPLRPELHIIVSCYLMDSENQIWVLCKRSRCSEPLSHLCNPQFSILT